LWHILDAWRTAADAEPAARSRGLLARALDAGVLEREPDSLLSTYAMFTLVMCDELDEARDRCTALIDLARQRGWLIALAHGSFLRARALIRAGRIRDAEADARIAFDIKLPTSPPAAIVFSLVPLAEALIELDELDDAEAVLAVTDLAGDPPSGDLCTPMVLELRARLRLAQHRPADAHADLTNAGDCWARLSQCHPGLAAWRVDDCEALVALGNLPAARAVARDHLDIAERVGLPGPYGAGLRALAGASDRAESIALLERAVDVLADSPARLEYTRALVDLGSALRKANRRAAAREPLLRALTLADSGGMRRLAHRARHELHAAGARPRRTALSGVDSLTPAEHRVATLAAQGRSNTEIAQQLYVTRRTVETHLTHAFQKLGVATRAKLKICLGDDDDPRTRTENAVVSRVGPC
jgi:DNA-binding NarL/FixJ family response regulator